MLPNSRPNPSSPSETPGPLPRKVSSDQRPLSRHSHEQKQRLGGLLFWTGPITLIGPIHPSAQGTMDTRTTGSPGPLLEDTKHNRARESLVPGSRQLTRRLDSRLAKPSQFRLGPPYK